MIPKSIKIDDELRTEYIQKLENWILARQQKISETEEKIKSGTSLSGQQKSDLKRIVHLLTRRITKHREMLIRFKNEKYVYSDLRSIWSIIGYDKSKSKDRSINQGASNSRNQSLQDYVNIQQLGSEHTEISQSIDMNNDLEYVDALEFQDDMSQMQPQQNDDGMINLSSTLQTIVLDDEEISKLMSEHFTADSVLADMSETFWPEPGPSRSDTSQVGIEIERLIAAQQQQNDDGMINLSSTLQTIVLDDEEISKLMSEHFTADSVLADMRVTFSPEPGPSRSDISQLVIEIDWLKAEIQKMDKKDEYLKAQLEKILEQKNIELQQQLQQLCQETMLQNFQYYSLNEADNGLSQNLNPIVDTYHPQLSQYINVPDDAEYVDALEFQDGMSQMHQQDTLVQPLSNEQNPQQQSQKNEDLIQQQPISSESQPNGSTISENNAAPKLTHNNLHLRSAPNLLGKRKAEFEQTKEEQIITHRQMRELQSLPLNQGSLLVKFCVQNKKIIELVESVNEHIQDKLKIMEHNVAEEKNMEIKKKLQKQVLNFKKQLENQKNLLIRFKERKSTFEEYKDLITISLNEVSRLKSLQHVQQSQKTSSTPLNFDNMARIPSPQPGPSHLDISLSVQQHSDANSSTHNTIFLKNPLNQLGKRKADFYHTGQDQIRVYNKLSELTDKRYRNVEENKQVQELQAPQSNVSNPLLSHWQKMRIIKLIDSSNSHDLKRFGDAKNEEKNEKDSKKRRAIYHQARIFRISYEKRRDMLNRFKEGKATQEDVDRLFKMSHIEEKRLQNFVNAQQQSNEPGPSRLDTSQPVSQLEHLNREEEYLKSKWEESQQETITLTEAKSQSQLQASAQPSPSRIDILTSPQQDDIEIAFSESDKELDELVETFLNSPCQSADVTITSPQPQTINWWTNLVQKLKVSFTPIPPDRILGADIRTKIRQETKSQSQLQASAQLGPSRIDILTSSQQDDIEIAFSESDKELDELVETILDSPCQSADVTITSPQIQTINWWTDLVQKFNVSFTAIPPDPILATDIRTKIRQEAKSRQQEKTRLKKVAAAKRELLKEKQKLVQDLKEELSKLLYQSWSNHGKLPEDLYNRYHKIKVLLKNTKSERDQLQEDVHDLKHYWKIITQALWEIVDTYVWLRDGFSSPGFRNEVENSFENQRKKLLNNLLPSLIDEERGACTENALDRVKTKFSEKSGIDLKDPKNLAEFNKSLERCKNSRIELQGWENFLDQVAHAKETRAAQQRQADSTPSGMAQKNARDEAASRAELDYLAQTLPQRLAEANLIRLQQAHKNRMTWMQQNPHKFSQIKPSHSSLESQQQKQQSGLQDANNLTATNFAEASARSRQVQKVQEKEMRLETAMKLWSQPEPKFKSDAEMFISANLLDRAVKIVSSNPYAFKPSPSLPEQAISTINRNTTRVIRSSRATIPNSTTYTAANPISSKNVSEQKTQQKKSTKTPVLE